MKITIIFFGAFIFFSCNKDKTDISKQDINLKQQFNSTILYDSVTDIDGNKYKTVQIGTQIWMAENLRTKLYNTGEVIPEVISSNEWDRLTTAAVCNYNNTNNIDSIKLFGKLYNWYAVKSNKLCPDGWHVSSKTEWENLKEYCINSGYNYDDTYVDNKFGISLSSEIGWKDDEISLSMFVGGLVYDDFNNKRNSTGFSALANGIRSKDGSFHDINEVPYLWTSTEGTSNYAWNYLINIGVEKSYNNPNNGMAVRCVKD